MQFWRISSCCLLNGKKTLRRSFFSSSHELRTAPESLRAKEMMHLSMMRNILDAGCCCI